MHKFCFIIVMCLLSFGLKAQQKIGSFDLPNLAQMALPESEINFGKITPDSLYSRTLEFTNTGQITLKIDTIISSCICADIYTENKFIEPGKSGKFTIFVKSSYPFDQLVRVIYNSDNSPHIIRIYGHL